MTGITGKVVIDCGIVSDLIDIASQCQPCGVDLTVGKIEFFVNHGVIDFDNSRRQLPKTVDAGMQYVYDADCYLVTFNETISCPPDCYGVIYPRSSLLRMGADLRGTIIDPGYKGKCQSMLVVHTIDGLKILPNAKVAQVVFTKLEQPAEKLYNGIYQNENL